jgi:Fe-S-cluster containining protein
MKMRLDRALLRTGYMASVAVGGAIFISGLGWATSLGTLLGLVVLTRVGIYLYFERYLAFRTFQDFSAEKVRHECIACGASCHLRVNLGKDDVERILGYAEEKRMQESVIEKSGNKYWLTRRSGGACVFLKFEEGTPRCSIYSIRPLACRLYPLIPTGNRLRVDPLCPGLSKTRGHTFKQHLITQEVGSHVRKVMGKI